MDARLVQCTSNQLSGVAWLVCNGAAQQDQKGQCYTSRAAMVAWVNMIDVVVWFPVVDR